LDEEAFAAFVARLTALRREHPALRRRRFLHGRELGPLGLKDVAWLSRAGREKDLGDWGDPANLCFGLLLDGAAGPDLGPDGEPLAGEVLLLLANAGPAAVPFRLPAGAGGGAAAWETLLDTAADPPPRRRHAPGASLRLPGRSLRLLLLSAAPPPRPPGRRPQPSGS
jgi:isoamylase